MSRLSWFGIGALMLVSVLLRQPLIFLAAIILSLLAGASELWARYSLTGVSYRRIIGRSRLFFGEETDVLVEVVNAKPLPLPWLRADDDWPVPLQDPAEMTRSFGRQRLVNVFTLRWYERVTRRYRIYGLRRGVWQFGPTQLRSGDLFGFDIRRSTVEQIDYVIVYPQTVPVAALGLPARHPFGEFKSNLRVVDDPVRITGAREYRQGDNYRYIHWKATARRQVLQTKVFEPSASRPVVIFLNVSTAERIHQGQDAELQEYAITAAASLSQHIWSDGHALGLYANALLAPVGRITQESSSVGRGRIRIPPRKHPEQLIRVLEALARIDNRGRWSLEALLQSESGRLVFGTTVIVISATVTSRVRMALADMSRKGYGVTLIALGNAALEPLIPGVTYHHIGGRERLAGLSELRFGQE